MISGAVPKFRLLIMSVLEKLSPFISICQFCGMLPFSMEYDPATKEFARFSFSFWHFITWWFVLIFFLQFVVPLVLISIFGNLLQEMSNDSSLPLTLSIMAGVNAVCLITQLVLCRWIVFCYYRQLRNTVEAIQAVERIFKSSSFTGYENSVSKRVAVGIILLVVAVSTNMRKKLLAIYTYILYLKYDNRE